MVFDPCAPPVGTYSKSCVLGAPPTKFYLLDHCGKRMVADLTDSVSFFKWGRALNNDSELELSLHLKGDSTGRACCEVLENARTWRNELIAVRDNETVWGPGPLVNIKIQREIVHLVSRDITAWLYVRLIHNDYTFVDVDLTTIAETVIKDALMLGDAVSLPEDVRDACILEYAQFIPAGKTGTREIRANQKSAGEVLQELVSDGLDYTVVNRSLIIGADLTYGPIGPLRDEDLIGDLEITEHGLAAATRWTVSGANATGSAGGVDSYYGLIERGAEGASASTLQPELNRQARDRLDSSNPPPLTINIPSEGFLHRNAPVCMEVLVPGTLVDITVRELCRAVDTRQRLTALQVTGDDKNERVAITIAPVGPLQLIESSD